MLADAGGDDGVVGRGVPEGLQDHLRLQAAAGVGRVVDQREPLLPAAEGRTPRRQPVAGQRVGHRAGHRRGALHRVGRRATVVAAGGLGVGQSQGVEGAQQVVDDRTAVADDGDVGPAHLVVFGRVDVHVDHLGLGGEGVHPAGDPVVEPAAQGDEQVGALHGGDRGVVAVHARHAQAQRVGVGEGAPGHQGGDHRNAGPLGQLPEPVGGPGLEDAAAGVDDGTLGGQDQLGGLADRRRVALGHRPVAGQVEVGGLGPVPLHGRLGDVLGHVDQDRSGAAGGGDVEGLGHHPRDVGGIGDQPVVLGDPHGDAGDVALLEGVGADGRGGDLPGHHHQGDGVHVGVGQGRHDVGGPGAAGHDGHAGPAGDLGVPLGHVARSLLVANEDVPDGRVDDRVVHGQDGAAGEAEHDLHLLHLQALDQRLCSCEFHRGAPLSTMVGGVGDVGRWSDRWRDMKTTSRLGGRRAHTAKDRRVRYETSTRVVTGLIGPFRMVPTLLHGGGRLDKWRTRP